MNVFLSCPPWKSSIRLGVADRWPLVPFFPSPSSSCYCCWPGLSPSLWHPLHCLSGWLWSRSSYVVCQKMSFASDVLFPLILWAAAAQWEIQEALVLEDGNQHNCMTRMQRCWDDEVGRHLLAAVTLSDCSQSWCPTRAQPPLWAITRGGLGWAFMSPSAVHL